MTMYKRRDHGVGFLRLFDPFTYFFLSVPKGSGGKLAQFGSCWAGLDSRLRSVGILRPGRYLSISSRFFAGLQLLFFHAPVRLRRWLLLLTLLWRISMFATYLPNLSYLHKSLSTGQATYIEILMSMFWSLWTLLLLLLLLLVYFSILMIVIRRRVYVHVHALAPPSTSPFGGAKSAVK